MSLHHAYERGHHHGHHHHGHSHAPATFGTAFAIATVLNVALVIIQVAYGVLAHSMALLADAGHNAGDVLALVLAWAATPFRKNIRRNVTPMASARPRSSPR